MQLLLQNHAKLDVFDRKEATPLHYAAKKGNLECVNALIQKSTFNTIHFVDKKGRTALHMAARQGHKYGLFD